MAWFKKAANKAANWKINNKNKLGYLYWRRYNYLRPVIWSKLDRSIRSSESMSIFKTRLLNWLI